jgi:hypothetical protein
MSRLRLSASRIRGWGEERPADHASALCLRYLLRKLQGCFEDTYDVLEERFFLIGRGLPSSPILRALLSRAKSLSRRNPRALATPRLS